MNTNTKLIGLLATFALGCSSHDTVDDPAADPGTFTEGGDGTAGDAMDAGDDEAEDDTGGADADDGTGDGPADGETGDDDSGDPGGDVGCEDSGTEHARAPVDCAAEGCTSWCDSATWPAGMPGAGDAVVIPAGTAVRLDCDVEVGSLTVEHGGALVASREVSSSLLLHGNLVVRGRVDLGTRDDRLPLDVSTEIIFDAPGDDGYVGTTGAGPDGLTPLTVLDSDVGVWVVDSGVLTAAGAAKRAWSRLLEGASAGDATFVVDGAAGWQPGDAMVLTPTAEQSEGDHFAQFDESTIAAVDGDEVTLQAAPTYAHAGCDDGCWRRGEAANLTRNVVIRSQDDDAHAHIIVGDQGVLQLDSVELRWLGPMHECSGGELPARRAAVYFHQQQWDADDSFVHHTSIWGGNRGFILQEVSHGVGICDVAGYDGEGTGFRLFFDAGSGLFWREDASQGTVYEHVLAAKLRVPTREVGCHRIQHRMGGIAPDGGEGSGAVDCATSGVGYEGSGADISGLQFKDSATGRPADFTFHDNTSHNNNGHGLFIWHNAAKVQPHYEGIELWSNEGAGLRHGAYSNPYVFDDLLALDNGGVSVALKIVPSGEHSPLQGARLDDLAIQSYVKVQTEPNELVNLQFSGENPLAFTQQHTACNDGIDEEMDPGSSKCNMVWLRIIDPVFGEGVTQPFDFGWTKNFHSRWDVEGFAYPGFPEVPASFTLYRVDNEVEGGCDYAPFSAWMVPCP